MTRREFPQAIKKAVVKRATKNSVVYCEECHLPAKKWQIDHIIADAHGGEPVLKNAQLLCDQCYAIKNPADTKIAAKIKRQEAKHLRAVKPKGNIKTRPKEPVVKEPDRNKPKKEPLPYRPMFVKDEGEK